MCGYVVITQSRGGFQPCLPCLVLDPGQCEEVQAPREVQKINSKEVCEARFIMRIDNHSAGECIVFAKRSALGGDLEVCSLGLETVNHAGEPGNKLLL